MYNQELAEAIIGALEEAFPKGRTLEELRTLLPKFRELSEEDWLDAIDALNRDGMVEGGLIRAGASNVLRAAYNIRVTSVARHALQRSRNATSTAPPAQDARKVMVVYGRDVRLREGLFTFLRAVNLDPIEFSKAIERTGKPLPHISEILQAAFANAQAVVALLTPDDEARLRTEFLLPSDAEDERELTGQPRPNVLFEAGMALTSHPDRTVLVQIGKVRRFSDIAGRHVVMMDGSVGKRQELALKLGLAGCPVDLSGTDWHTAGDLSPPSIPRPRTVGVPSSLLSMAIGDAALRAYIQTERIRALDERIAGGASVELSGGKTSVSLYSQMLAEKASHLGLNTIRELEEVVEEMGEAAVLASFFFLHSTGVYVGESLNYVLDLKAAEPENLSSLKAYYRSVKSPVVSARRDPKQMLEVLGKVRPAFRRA